MGGPNRKRAFLIVAEQRQGQRRYSVDRLTEGRVNPSTGTGVKKTKGQEACPKKGTGKV